MNAVSDSFLQTFFHFLLYFFDTLTEKVKNLRNSIPVKLLKLKQLQDAIEEHLTSEEPFWSGERRFFRLHKDQKEMFFEEPLTEWIFVEPNMHLQRHRCEEPLRVHDVSWRLIMTFSLLLIKTHETWWFLELFQAFKLHCTFLFFFFWSFFFFFFFFFSSSLELSEEELHDSWQTREKRCIKRHGNLFPPQDIKKAVLTFYLTVQRKLTIARYKLAIRKINTTIVFFFFFFFLNYYYYYSMSSLT